MYYYSDSLRSNFESVLFYCLIFELTVILKQVHQMTQKLCSTIPKFPFISLYTQLFSNYMGHFETWALNDWPWTICSQGSYCPHTHVYMLLVHPESQIIIHFSLLPAPHFQVTGHCETSAPNDTTTTYWTILGMRSKSPHMCSASTCTCESQISMH